MRNFPNSTDLSDRQKAIYTADLNSAMMILGPPGTGKTVLAIHRGMRLLELNEESIGLFMYNNTLKHYTQHQTSQDRRLANTVKTVMKHIGDRFRLIGRYINWGAGYELQEFPYDAYSGRYIDFSDSDKQKLFPKYTILDEGQDYPEAFYKLVAKHWVTSRARKFEFYPTIMADENQRLEPGKNADVDTIETVLGSIANVESLYSKKVLTENYRNTLPIAELGSRFYVGINDQAELPIKKGNKPTFFFFNDYKELATRIIKYKFTFPNQTIGILFSRNASKNMVIKMNNALIRALENRGSDLASNINIQYFLSGASVVLDFTSSNTITVLTYQSSKGLEFDTVFIPDIETLDTQNNFFDDAMKMYVLLHRPREMLFLAALKNSEDSKESSPLPSFFTQKIKCFDGGGKEISIGFNGLDDARNLINIEDEENQDSKLDDASQASTAAQSVIKSAVTPKDIPKISKETQVRNQKKVDAIFEAIKDLQFKKLPDILKKEIDGLGTADRSSLLEKWNAFSNEKRKNIRREKLTSKQPKNSKALNSSKPKLPPTAKKNKQNIQDDTILVSYVSGGGNSIDQKIVDTIKNQMIKQNIEVINIISVSEQASSVLQRLNASLSTNRLGIAEYFMLNERDNKIVFADIKKRKKEIRVGNPDDQIDFTESIIILGLENIRATELEANIGDLLLHLMTNERKITEFILPELDFEIPAITFIKEKMDDGSLKENKYEY